MLYVVLYPHRDISIRCVITFLPCTAHAAIDSIFDSAEYTCLPSTFHIIDIVRLEIQAVHLSYVCIMYLQGRL